MITPFTRIVHVGQMPLFFRHIRPFLIKLERHRMQVTHQTVMQLIADRSAHAQQTANRIFGYPDQGRRGIQATGSI